MTDSLNPKDLGFWVFSDIKKDIEYQTNIRVVRIWEFAGHDIFGGEVVLKIVPTGAFKHMVQYNPNNLPFGLGRNDDQGYIEDWFEEARYQYMDAKFVLEAVTETPGFHMEREFFNAARLMAKWMPVEEGVVKEIEAPEPSQSPFSEDPQNPRTLQVNWEKSSNVKLELLEYNTNDVFSDIGDGRYSFKYVWTVRLWLRLSDPYKLGENLDPQDS
jgi:hypothetical protein